MLPYPVYRKMPGVSIGVNRRHGGGEFYDWVYSGSSTRSTPVINRCGRCGVQRVVKERMNKMVSNKNK